MPGFTVVHPGTVLTRGIAKGLWWWWGGVFGTLSSGQHLLLAWDGGCSRRGGCFGVTWLQGQGLVEGAATERRGAKGRVHARMPACLALPL